MDLRTPLQIGHLFGSYGPPPHRSGYPLQGGEGGRCVVRVSAKVVKGKEGDTVAFRHNELKIPFSEVEAAGGEKKSTRFGKSSYYASHFPPGDVPGGREVEASPGRVSQGEGQREVSH